MSSGVDCQETYNGFMRCRCRNIEDCCYADKCELYRWRRTDFDVDGFWHCQRPRNEPIGEDP